MYLPKSQNLQWSIKNAPKTPGVYMFRNKSDKILYIGKAVNLFNRVRSYFINYKRLDPRIKIMIDKAYKLEFLEVENEVEALLLEANLIKKYLPEFNIQLRDDKNYIWIKISSKMDFPKVEIVRKKENKHADYFGPYPNKAPIKRMIKKLRKIFLFRSCNRKIEVHKNIKKKFPKNKYNPKTQVYSSNTKPCLYYHIGLCSAPCNTKEKKQIYRQNINSLKRFLRSEHQDLKTNLKNKMNKYSQNQKYEKAAHIRDQLHDIEYLTKFSRITENVDDNIFKKKKIDFYLQSVKELINKLDLKYSKSLSNLKNFRIECYDISNIQGSYATSSMVVFKGGIKMKNLYRKFKIKQKSSPDDYKMMKETLNRRLKYLIPNNKKIKPDKSFCKKPDLIIVDGGKGQLNSAKQVIDKFKPLMGFEIACAGIAKKEEEVFTIQNNKFIKHKFSKRSPALKLIQNLRDEAHRFGLGYHKLLRSKGMKYSQLDLIPGVGEITKKKLILHFGSVQKIKKAKLEDINSIIKNKSTAQKIKKLLI